MAETAGDPESSGRAYLAILEELNSFLPSSQIVTLYAYADGRLGEDLSQETMNRLRACARLLSVEAASSPFPATTMRTSFEEKKKLRSVKAA